MVNLLCSDVDSLPNAKHYRIEFHVRLTSLCDHRLDWTGDGLFVSIKLLIEIL